MFEAKQVVVDCRGHLMGRLASTVAKELLNGQNVVLVRCDEANISGSFIRNKINFMHFLKKRMNTNPDKGPFHHRAPSRMIWRVIRGMMPHKTDRGAIAMQRLKVFDGLPPPYDKLKRMVIPNALTVTRLKPKRKFCTVGRLSHEVGWKHFDMVRELEEKRKVKSAAFYARKKAQTKLRNQAAETAGKTAAVRKVAPILASYGY